MAEISTPPSVKNLPTRPRVVVVGGGFAGMNAAMTLADMKVDVTLIDRRNHHTFQPLLYQVAAGVLSPGQISAPLRRVLRAGNIEVLLGDVAAIEPEQRTVRLEGEHEIPYDTLVLAAGARHAYFGHDEWAEFAPGLKTLEDAVDMRRRVLLAFEEAEREAFETGNAPELNFAVVGAGPTGVELAGALADIARRVLVRDFKHIDTTKTRILLFEGANRVLGALPPEVSSSAKKQLEELGVEVRLSSLVTKIEAGRIEVGGLWIPTQVVLWASGVQASPLARSLGAEMDRAGRVLVSPDLSVPERPETFVIGDMASLQGVPGLGAAAVQMGRLTAANILGELAGKPRIPFVHRDKGTLATIGRHRAVAVIGKFKLSGIIAWLMWAMVHIALLIGFANRLRVMLEWIGAYFSSQRGARLITEPWD